VIAKHVSMKSVRKSDFARLAKYILDAQHKNERVGCVTLTHCQSDRLDAAIIEIANTQAQNTRAGSSNAAEKTYHLIVSFRSGEQPEPATLAKIESRLCAALGFAEHQRISAVHHDTDHLHIHIAINRIHPVRHTIHHPYRDYKTLDSLCEKLEIEFGLERDNHHPQKNAAQNLVADMEHHAGVESLLGWIQRECMAQIRGASSWDALHRVMHSNGLELHARGNGLVITALDGTSVKASSVGRDCSKAQLEARLGAFAPSIKRLDGASPARQYQKQPMRLARNTAANTVELYARYKNEQGNFGALRTDQWAKARDRKNRLIEAAKRSARLKRAAIKLVQGAGSGKKLLHALTSKTLRDDIAQINRQYFRERQAIHDQYSRMAWADWLRMKSLAGDLEALAALRARTAAGGFKGDTVSGRGRLAGIETKQSSNIKQNSTKQSSNIKQDSITKLGTVIYRAGTTAVRDDGDKLTISRGAHQDGLQAALRMAMARYGNLISIHGSAAFKEQVVQAAAAAQLPITLDDAVLERRRQELLRPTEASATTKENEHAQSDPSAPARPAGRRPVGTGSTSAGAGAEAVRQQKQAHVEQAVPPAGRGPKLDIGRIGQAPPPASRHRLRNLSELGVVRIAGGSEVLLPGHVPGHLEQQGGAADHGLRRRVPRPSQSGESGGAGQSGPLSAGLAAADRYILEREQKRLTLPDIPKHVRYHEHVGPVQFSGIRQVEGQALALLRNGDEIMVLPIDAAGARRLKQLAIGDAVAITARGTIAAKGRGR
jgi:hypothetical protein